MAKHLAEDDVAHIYRKANSEQIVWEYLFDDVINSYFTDMCEANNFPMPFLLGTLLPATAALCGTKTSVKTGNFVNSLNTFSIVIGEPGCGKSRCSAKLWAPMEERISSKFEVEMTIENFTGAGFQRHQKDNQGYGLITSSEGQRQLAAIHAKQSKHEGEESRLNNVWDGVGDSTQLKGGARGYPKTAVCMCLYIQPEPLITEMASLMTTNGFFERMLFFSAKPNLFSCDKNQTAEDRLSVFPKDLMAQLAEEIFILHRENERQYVLDEDAYAYYKKECDSYNRSIMARHEDLSDPDNSDAEVENGENLYYNTLYITQIH